MDISFVSHHAAPPLMFDARAQAASANAAELLAAEFAMSEVTSDRAAKRAGYDDATLAPPSVNPQAAGKLAQILASVMDGPDDARSLSPLAREVARRHDEMAPVAARMLLDNPALNPLEMLDQLDPMLAQSAAIAVAARSAPEPTAPAAKRDVETTSESVGKSGEPRTSSSMDRLKALIAILILADLLRDSAKEDQARQLERSVANTGLSAEKMVSAARSNVGGAAAGLTLTAGLAGAGTVKVLQGNKQTRVSIDNNLTAANEATKNSHAASFEARKLQAEADVEKSRSSIGGTVSTEAKQAEYSKKLLDLQETHNTQAARSAELQTEHARDASLAQDEVSYGQPLIHGAGSASNLASQGGAYDASMKQRDSTLAKSDADIAQATADTERDAAAAHTETKNKALDLIQNLAKQEERRNEQIATFRAA